MVEGEKEVAVEGAYGSCYVTQKSTVVGEAVLLRWQARQIWGPAESKSSHAGNSPLSKMNVQFKYPGGMRRSRSQARNDSGVYVRVPIATIPQVNIRGLSEGRQAGPRFQYSTE